jgi:hypothetical protein
MEFNNGEEQYEELKVETFEHQDNQPDLRTNHLSKKSNKKGALYDPELLEELEEVF